MAVARALLPLVVAYLQLARPHRPSAIGTGRVRPMLLPSAPSPSPAPTPNPNPKHTGTGRVRQMLLVLRLDAVRAAVPKLHALLGTA